MFRLGDPDPWHLSADNDVGVNFVVSCLIKDGLQIPPFTDHPAGDGQLEALGLNEKIWAFPAPALRAPATLSGLTLLTGLFPGEASSRRRCDPCASVPWSSLNATDELRA